MEADPACRWCKGGGRVMLLNKWADCDCLSESEGHDGTSTEDVVQAMLGCIKEIGEPQSQTFSDDDLVVFDLFPREGED